MPNDFGRKTIEVPHIDIEDIFSTLALEDGPSSLLRVIAEAGLDVNRTVVLANSI
jgi:hypothetical protein